MEIYNRLERYEPICPTDPLGIEAWSSSYDLASHTGLAIIASVLSGVAGPFLFLNVQRGRQVAGLNLVGMESDGFLGAALSDLLAPIDIIQRTLLAKSSEFTMAELEGAMYQPDSATSKSSELRGLAADSETRAADHGIGERMNKDLDLSDRSIRFEGLVRPRFMLTGSLPKDLGKILSECHSGVGYAADCIERLPGNKTRRNERLDKILDFTRGVHLASSPARTRTPVGWDAVTLRGILRFPGDRFRSLVAERRDVFDHFIPVASATPDEPLDIDQNGLVRFHKRFKGAATQIIGHRRAYAWADAVLSDQNVLKFMHQHRVYCRELQAIARNYPVREAEGLPIVMAWAQLVLAGTRSSELEDWIIGMAFDAARSVVADAIRIFRLHDESVLMGQRLEHAKKLLQRLATHGPLSRRNLVRGFDNQSMDLHGPVIDLLVQLGVLVERPGKILASGTVPITALTPEKFLPEPQS